MRLGFRLCVLSVVLISACAGVARAQTADEVIEKHLAALGGRDALAKITSRRSTGTIAIGTPAGDLSGPVELLSKGPNKSRAYMQLDLSPLGVPDKMIIEQKFDGTSGWALNSLQGDTPITGNQLDNMRNNVFPSPFLDYKESGARIELLPRAQAGGRDAIVLLVTPKTGSVAKVFLDASTYLPIRTETTVTSPEVGQLEQVVEYSDYRGVDGIQVAFRIVNTNPLQTVTVVVQKVEHNVPIDDAVFSVR